jgi:hypothetical protein
MAAKGKSMAESPKDLKITGKEWEAFLDDFQQTSTVHAVPLVPLRPLSRRAHFA